LYKEDDEVVNQQEEFEDSYSEELLESLKKNRSDLIAMVDELEGFKKNISSLFPEKLDQRYVRLFEEKIRTITSLFQLILEIRKEFTKQIVQEIEVRRKLKLDGNEDDISDIIDIREVARKVENLQKEKLKLQV
jgi:hypothetical protein